jgi:hypothetical protein
MTDPVGPEPAALLARRIDGLRGYCWTRLDQALADQVSAWTRPVPDRANSDYVYRTEDLRALAGKAYHAKRNYARRFAELYQPEVRPLTAALAAGCVHVQEQWLEDLRNNKSARDESSALIKALRHFEVEKYTLRVRRPAVTRSHEPPESEAVGARG